MKQSTWLPSELPPTRHPQVTRCLNCGTMLTDAMGVRAASANFDSSLPTFPMRAIYGGGLYQNVIWARCDVCMAATQGRAPSNMTLEQRCETCRWHNADQRTREFPRADYCRRHQADCVVLGHRCGVWMRRAQWLSE